MSYWNNYQAATDLGQVAYEARMTDATPWENLSERERNGWRALANTVAQAAEARRAYMSLNQSETTPTAQVSRPGGAGNQETESSAGPAGNGLGVASWEAGTARPSGRDGATIHGPGRSAIAFVIDAHRFGLLSEGEAMALTRLDRIDVRGLVLEHAREGYADPGAERLIRAVSVWGAMAAALHRDSQISAPHYLSGPIVWIPSGPMPQPRWFGDQSPHVKEGWPVGGTK